MVHPQLQMHEALEGIVRALRRALKRTFKHEIIAHVKVIHDMVESYKIS